MGKVCAEGEHHVKSYCRGKPNEPKPRKKKGVTWASSVKNKKLFWPSIGPKKKGEWSAPPAKEVKKKTFSKALYKSMMGHKSKKPKKKTFSKALYKSMMGHK